MRKDILTKFQKEVLKIMGKNEFFRNNFYWCGGTALSYCYLKHRLSEDSDFFSKDLFAQEVLLKKFNELGLEKIGYFEKLNRQRFIVKRGKRNLQLEFVYFPFKPIGGLKLIKEFNIKINSLKDLAANKILAVYERHEPKDVFDIYFILHKKRFNLKKLLEDVNKKFGVEIDEADLAAKILRGVEELKKIKPLLLEEKDFYKEIKDFFSEKASRYLDLFM